jgi:hypothetical protein
MLDVAFGVQKQFIDTGIGIVAEQLRISHGIADKTVTDWLKRCGRDAAGLRQIISDAVAEGLPKGRASASVSGETLLAGKVAGFTSTTWGMASAEN